MQLKSRQRGPLSGCVMPSHLYSPASSSPEAVYQLSLNVNHRVSFKLWLSKRNALHHLVFHSTALVQTSRPTVILFFIHGSRRSRQMKTSPLTLIGRRKKTSQIIPMCRFNFHLPRCLRSFRKKEEKKKHRSPACSAHFHLRG